MTVHRRHRGLALGLGLAVALALTACSAGKKTAANQDPAGSAGVTVMTPAAKGSLDKVTWNVWEGEPSTIDPMLSADYSPNTINSNLCETLLAQNPDYSITPNLVTAYTNPDPLHWVYTLRTDVKFWDGAPMTAEDVAYSLTRNLKNTQSFYNYLYGRVNSVDVTGANQVTVTLKEPDYLFNAELSNFAGAVVQKKFTEAHPQDFGAPNVGVMCTGPFTFQSWAKGDSITVVRNDQYWDAKRAPKVKTLTFKFITDEAAITSALLTGEIDGAYDPPMSSLTQLTASSAGKLYYGPHESNMTFVYCNPSGAMANLKLRQALQMAVDWNGIAHTLLKDTATPLRGSVPPSVFSYGKGALQPAYDALPAPQSAQYDQAKALVQQAGADAQKEVVFAVPSAYTWTAFANSVADSAKRIGMNLRVKVVATDQYTNYLYDPKTRAGVDMLATDFWPNVPEPLDWFGITALTTGSFNQWGYTGINDLYAKAVATKDDAARAALMVAMQQKVRDDLLPMVPGLYHTSRVWMNKRMTGAPASFSYVYYPWAVSLGAA